MNFGNVFILGDSYSTYQGYIPDGNANYYVGHRNDNDVNNVEQTWWHKVLKATNSKLVLNESHAGSTVCNTGYRGEICEDTSFIGRLEKQISNGVFVENKIDTVFIFGGTNDFWANSPIGEEIYDNFDNDSKKLVIPAFSYIINRIFRLEPEIGIIVLINGKFINDEILNGFKNVCSYYGVKYISMNDFDTMGDHPSIKGMDEIANSILSDGSLV